MSSHYPFTLLPLPYSYEALSPAIGEETLHFHHDKHMSTYVENLNKALEAHPDLQGLSLESLLKKLDRLPKDVQTAVQNNGGGVYNHQLYFSTLANPNSGTKPSEDIKKAIERDFGGIEKMFEQLKKAALGRFGSGWAYVVTDENGVLSICSTANQDVPELCSFLPLFTVDVWEHAYYLDYQNRRADYFDAFTSLINWDAVSRIYKERSSHF